MAHSEGVMLAPGEGQRIFGGGIDATVLVAMSHPSFASTFEVRVPPGFDVGAHVHTHGEEIFYVVKGTVDVLAFEPLDRSVKDWHQWKSGDGKTYLRGGPGSFLYVPPNVPHAFGNSRRRSGDVLSVLCPGRPRQLLSRTCRSAHAHEWSASESDMVQLRHRYDIEQISALNAGRR